MAKFKATMMVPGKAYVAKFWVKPGSYKLENVLFISRTSDAQLKMGEAEYTLQGVNGLFDAVPSKDGKHLVTNFNGKMKRITFAELGGIVEATAAPMLLITHDPIEVIAEAVEESKIERKRRLDRDRKKAQRAAKKAAALEAE